MITYTVKYRKSGSLFWKKVKDIKGDAIIPNTTIVQLIHNNESLTEINLQDHEVNFSKERFYSIKDRMSKEAGTEVKIDER